MAYEFTRKIKMIFKTERGISRLISRLKSMVQEKEYVNSEKRGNGGDEKVAHVTYYVAANAGDTVLSQCVRRTLQSHLKISEWNLIQVTDPVTNEIIDAINNCEKLIIGGGGLFLPDTNENTISGWQWAISPDDIRKITAEIIVFSVGYNYFPGQEPSDIFEQSIFTLVQKSSFFGLRNKGSVRSVRGLVPPEMRDKIVFQPCTTTLIRKLYNDYLPTKKDTQNIAINMAFDREELRYGDAKDTILKQVALAARRIQERGYKVYYVCHCREDDKFLSHLKEAKVIYKLVDLSRQYPDKVMNFYNQMDLVIGMRGHAQMIPFGLNCEIISLGTHDKMKWFLEDINAIDWYIDLKERPDHLSDEIVNKFIYIHEQNRDLTLNRLLEAQNMLWNITCHNLEILGGYLNK